MKSIQILGLLVAAGALGAVAGGMTGAFSQRAEAVPDSVLVDRLDELARSMDALREAASDARNDVADVSERLVAVELELSRRASAGTPVAVTAADDPAAAPVAELDAEEIRRALTRRVGDLKVRLSDVRAASAAATATQERFAKGIKIRAMPEDERWQHAADTLGLNSVQVDEIKAAHAELQEGLKAAVVEDTNESGGSVVTFRRVDGNKMRDAQTAFQSRVDNALNDEQKKAWNEEGFGHALGRRGGMSTFRVRGRSPVRLDPAAISTGGTIEIVTTETSE